jgi:hypothetical protein
LSRCSSADSFLVCLPCHRDTTPLQASSLLAGFSSHMILDASPCHPVRYKSVGLFGCYSFWSLDGAFSSGGGNGVTCLFVYFCLSPMFLVRIKIVALLFQGWITDGWTNGGNGAYIIPASVSHPFHGLLSSLFLMVCLYGGWMDIEIGN